MHLYDYRIFIKYLNDLSLNKEKGGEGDDSHTSDSCFPGEFVITSMRFAGARQ